MRIYKFIDVDSKGFIIFVFILKWNKNDLNLILLRRGGVLEYKERYRR